MEGAIIGFSLAVALIVVGVPIGAAFGVFCFFLLAWFGINPSFLIATIFLKLTSVILLAIPFFILLGSIMNASGLSDRLVEFVHSVIGHVKGGLGAVTVGALAIFGAISGTNSAATASIGTIMIPRMEEHGYPRGHATALVACAGILGELVPPSVPMIFYAVVTNNTVPACWAATVGPAIVMVIVYSVLNRVAIRRFQIKVRARPAGWRQYFKGVTRGTYLAGPVLLLPVVVLGGVYGGVVTPTEAACVGVLYILAVTLVSRSAGFAEIRKSVVSAAVLTGEVTFMVFFILTASKLLVMGGVTKELANWIVSSSPNVYVTLLLLNVVLIVIGMMMDDLSGTLLASALLYPIASAAGIHPLHFAAIIGVNLGLGNVTPPTAPNLYLAGRIGNCEVAQYIRPAMYFMWVGMVPVMLVTTYWPPLSLAIPTVMGFVH